MSCDVCGDLDHTTSECAEVSYARRLTHVWVVITEDSFDPVFVFEREDDARAFAAAVGEESAWMPATEHPIIDDATATEMIREMENPS